MNINKYIKERQELFEEKFVRKYEGTALLEPLDAIDVQDFQTETIQGIIELLEEQVEGMKSNREFADRDAKKARNPRIAEMLGRQAGTNEAVDTFKQTLNNIKKTIN